MKSFDILKQQDFTEGNVGKQIILFSIPLLIGNITQQLYNTVDAIVVSKYVGDTALGAVGAASPLINFLIMVYVAISTGASVLVSQYYGAKDREKLSRTIGTTYLLVFISSIFLMIISYVSTDAILKLLNTPEDIFHLSSVYTKTVFIGILSMALYNVFMANLRALGDSIFPLVALLISTVINIILDIIFVKFLNLSTFGVAIATVIAQSISAIMCYLKVRTLKHIYDQGFKYVRYDKLIVRQILGLGLPNACTQGIFSLSMMFLQGLTNSFGSLIVTANTAVVRIDGFVMQPNFTFGIASTTFTAQNIGAKKIDRVYEGASKTLFYGLIVSITLALCLVFFGGQLASIFTQTQIIIDYAAKFMRVLAIGYVAFTATQVYGGVMRGAGDSLTPMWISIFSIVILRTPLAFLLVHLSKTPSTPLGDPTMVNVSLAISWVTSSLLTIFFYKKGIWKKRIGYLK